MNDNDKTINEISDFHNELKELTESISSRLIKVRNALNDNNEEQEKLLSRYDSIEKTATLAEIKTNLKHTFQVGSEGFKHKKKGTLAAMTTPRDRTISEYRNQYSFLTETDGKPDPNFFVYMLMPFLLKNIDAIAKDIAPDELMDFEQKQKQLNEIDSQLEVLKNEEDLIKKNLSDNPSLDFSYDFIEEPNDIISKPTSKTPGTTTIKKEEDPNEFKVTINGE